MKPLLVLDVVGLTLAQLGEHTPHLTRLARRGAQAPLSAVLPAVTCSAQATFLTGLEPDGHGAVGNGWFFRELGEVWFWRQSNRLVAGEKVYERARALDPSFTCAKLFWWWNMGAEVEWSITPRPHYPADGRKILAVYGTPGGFAEETEAELGKFPFFQFWGPKAGLASSRWITDAALRTLAQHEPTLSLVYLPHLDYDHQRFGPRAERSLAALAEVDALVGELVEAADARGAAVLVLSEYGIEPVRRPVFLNRALREAGLLKVRESPVGDGLDTFASRAFAVCDHQVAHVYAADEGAARAATDLLGELDGVESVFAGSERSAIHLDHPRAGDLICVAQTDAWFAYPFWLDPGRAPDFAPTVDIHRKPGYDPCELFIDPELKLPAARVARRLAQKALGMRYLMDVIPLDASLVRGSHGRLPTNPTQGPLFLSSEPWSACGGEPDSGVVAATSVAQRILRLLQRT